MMRMQNHISKLRWATKKQWQGHRAKSYLQTNGSRTLNKGGGNKKKKHQKHKKKKKKQKKKQKKKHNKKKKKKKTTTLTDRPTPWRRPQRLVAGGTVGGAVGRGGETGEDGQETTTTKPKGGEIWLTRGGDVSGQKS